MTIKAQTDPTPELTGGYPHAIPLTLTEDELVDLQKALGDDNAQLRRKLRAAQIEAFAKAHG